MQTDADKLAELIAKDAIRELAQLYSRGVDRQDFALLRTLYTADGMDWHGDFFGGTASDFIDKLEKSLPSFTFIAHFVCNHLISVDGDEAEGEVYAISHLVQPGPDAKMTEYIDGVRYCDRYRKEADGRWRFVSRNVSFDYVSKQQVAEGLVTPPKPDGDPSVTILKHRLFHRGPRA